MVKKNRSRIGFGIRLTFKRFRPKRLNDHLIRFGTRRIKVPMSHSTLGKWIEGSLNDFRILQRQADFHPEI